MTPGRWSSSSLCTPEMAVRVRFEDVLRRRRKRVRHPTSDMRGRRSGGRRWCGFWLLCRRRGFFFRDRRGCGGPWGCFGRASRISGGFRRLDRRRIGGRRGSRGSSSMSSGMVPALWRVGLAVRQSGRRVVPLMRGLWCWICCIRQRKIHDTQYELQTHGSSILESLVRSSDHCPLVDSSSRIVFGTDTRRCVRKTAGLGSRLGGSNTAVAVGVWMERNPLPFGTEMKGSRRLTTDAVCKLVNTRLSRTSYKPRGGV